MSTRTQIQTFFDPKTWTVSSDTNAADTLLDDVKAEKLAVQWILGTHAHADHALPTRK